MICDQSKLSLKKKIVICICGLAGSGKSTVAKRLAEHYGLRYYSGGDALKDVAADLGYKTSEKGWWETISGLSFLQKRLNDLELDRKVDEKLLDLAKKGGIVFDSWTMPWLLKKGFKIWLEASEEERAKRVAKRDNLTVEEALSFLRERESKTKATYEKLYGFKIGEDFEPFHLILDVNLLDEEEVFQALRMVVDSLLLKELKSVASES
ncbi:MAG: cytidylate kinase family protein [Candidatus Bathyarchaeia archaeon]